MTGRAAIRHAGRDLTAHADPLADALWTATEPDPPGLDRVTVTAAVAADSRRQPRHGLRTGIP